LSKLNKLRQNKEISHVAHCAVEANMVGEYGVSAPSADYDWTKRRRNERPK
jgi:hypothetical protein